MFTSLPIVRRVPPAMKQTQSPRPGNNEGTRAQTGCGAFLFPGDKLPSAPSATSRRWSTLKAWCERKHDLPIYYRIVTGSFPSLLLSWRV